jgi:hypothetical protein
MGDPRVHTKSLSQSCNRPPPISASTATSHLAAHTNMASPSMGVWAHPSKGDPRWWNAFLDEVREFVDSGGLPGDVAGVGGAAVERTVPGAL